MNSAMNLKILTNTDLEQYQFLMKSLSSDFKDVRGKMMTLSNIKKTLRRKVMQIVDSR